MIVPPQPEAALPGATGTPGGTDLLRLGTHALRKRRLWFIQAEYKAIYSQYGNVRQKEMD